MVRRTVEVAEGPDWTDVFKSSLLDGGEDETPQGGLLGALLSVSDDEGGAVEYRVEDPPDPVGDFGTLRPGDAIPLHGATRPIRHVVARGVGGARDVQIESTSV